MNTITKIGKAALTRLFSSKKFNADKITFDDFGFNLAGIVPPDEAGGTKWFGDHSIKDEGTSYYIWSIELGLHSLEAAEGETFADAIANFLRNHSPFGPYPSHIIVCSGWSDDEEDECRYVYAIHRFTQEEDRAIETRGSFRSFVLP